MNSEWERREIQRARATERVEQRQKLFPIRLVSIDRIRDWRCDDADTVDQIVFEQAAPFFRDSLNPRGATFEVKPVIEQIVAGQKPELTGNQSRFLLRRGLITGEGTLAFPILARWLNEYAE